MHVVKTQLLRQPNGDEPEARQTRGEAKDIERRIDSISENGSPGRSTKNNDHEQRFPTKVPTKLDYF
jgi:hypothetical protein